MKIRIKSYLSLVKFSHTIFAMPFAITAFFMATQEDKYTFNWQVLGLVVLCMIFARNSAMAFNRYSDRVIDGQNPRTSNREIPAKAISANNALTFTIINSALFIAASSFINTTTLILSPIALFVLLAYSYTKRFTFLSHIFLGLALAIAPAGAYIAVTGTLSISVILLSFSVLFWTAGFDIIYALQDEKFDKENGLFSIPAAFGAKNALIISAVLHFFTTILLIFWGAIMDAAILQWIGVFIFNVLLIYQHIIVKPNDISKVNIAFGTTNGIASTVLGVLTIISFFM
ncbi:MAG: UbiA family prenyltransferase [Bacteroidales bacterium]|nr:UbiA family prenyltransferase [Bacteroidales bacterium]